MQKVSLRRLIVAAILGVTGGAESFAQAAPILWTGAAGDHDWATVGNWTGNSPPAPTTYTDQGAEFNAGPTSITDTPDSSGVNYRTVSGITFDTAGWTIGTNQIDTGPITSNGIGTNTLNAEIGYDNGTAANGYVSPATWHMGTGNTLAVQSLYLNNSTVVLDGGGQLNLTGTGVWGWGTGNNVNINNATLQIDSATPYYQSNATGVITLEDPGQSFVQLETTLANTESYFGNEIVGNGGTLVATDLQNGFTLVSLVGTPEPSTVGLLALAVVGGLWRRRRPGCA